MEDITAYYAHYCESKSLYKTARHFKKDELRLKKGFKELGLTFPLPATNKKLEYNEHFFSDIDTAAKAYILGFIYADGCIYTRNRSATKNGCEKVLSINLAEKDVEILQYLAKQLEYSGNLRQKPQEQFTSPTGVSYTRAPQYCLAISNATLVDGLIKQGVTTRKSSNADLRMPELKQELRSHFIRGFFDGDGCAFLTKNRYVPTSTRKLSGFKPKAYANFTCGNPLFLEDVSTELFCNGIASRHGRCKQAWKLSIPRGSMADFYNYLYKEDCFSLARKKNILAPTD